MLEIENVLIIDYSSLAEDHFKETDKIVEHTANTWQLNRGKSEKAADTSLGKLAELVFMLALKKNAMKNYLSYDEIRSDDFKLHAPFDGVFFKEISNEIIEAINENVKQHGPKLTSDFRNHLRRNGLLTVEVKSTRIAQRHGFPDYNNNESIRKTIEKIKNDDFLNYPYYFRAGNIDSYSKYCHIVEREYLNSGFHSAELHQFVKNIELENAADLFVRVYMDEGNKKAFIIGWIEKEILFDEPKIKKMFQRGKSERPIYFYVTLKKAKKLDKLESFLKDNGL